MKIDNNKSHSTPEINVPALGACELRPVAALSWVGQIKSNTVAVGDENPSKSVTQVATLCPFQRFDQNSGRSI